MSDVIWRLRIRVALRCMLARKYGWNDRPWTFSKLVERIIAFNSVRFCNPFISCPKDVACKIARSMVASELAGESVTECTKDFWIG